MERVALESFKWALAKGDVTEEASKSGRRRRIKVLQRYPFASSLARMATIVELTEGKAPARYMVLAKGAPETMAGFFSTLPPNFEATYKHFARSLPAPCPALRLSIAVVCSQRRDEKKEGGNWRWRCVQRLHHRWRRVC